MSYPPIPRFPQEIDDDHTLFLVYNTTETRLSADNSPWAQEVDIIPVKIGKPEIWADNGFANIEGELLYYDAVEKDGQDRVVKLKRCARQLGGEHTKFNPKGTWIRSYVVAEHHNQLVTSMLKTEDFVGRNYDIRQPTLDWRIRNLEALEIIFDDFDCPDIDFTFNIVETNPVTGTLASYRLAFTPPGTITSFRLDFGDGDSTTTELAGTHRYAVNARIDPVVTAGNEKCKIVQTPVERLNPAEPTPEALQVFEIPIPEIPDIPDFTFVPCEVPEPNINLPPLVFPCVSLEGGIGIPSIITGPSINMVSNVVITGPELPVEILYSAVTITGQGIPNIPSYIYGDIPSIPPTMIIEPPIPPTIVLMTPSQIAFQLDATEIPRLEVDWGKPPDMEVALTLAQRVKTPQKFAADPEIVKQFGVEFADLFQATNTMKVEYESVGIPEEIVMIPPSEFPEIKTDIPKRIIIDAEGVNLPTDIIIHGPESPLPNSIKLDASELPEGIDLVYRGDPIKLKLETPPSIKLEMEKEIPQRIYVETLQPIPDKIIVDGVPDKIILEGPASIPLVLPDDIGIPVIFPEKMPEIELVWRGSPIEVKVTMDDIMPKDAEGKPCFTFVPCK